MNKGTLEQVLTSNILTSESVGDAFYTISTILPDPDEILRLKGYDYSFFRNLLKEPLFDGIWDKRIGHLVRNNYFFIPPDGSKPNKEIAMYFENWMNQQNLDSLFSGFLEAVLFGYSPFEVIWEKQKFNNKEIWGIKSLEQKKQEWFGFDKNGFPKKRVGYFNYENLDPFKFVITRYRPTYTNPYGKKLVSVIFWMLVFKKGGWRFFTIFLEKFGGASALAGIPESKYEDESFRDDVLRSLELLRSGGVGVFPEGVKAELVESKDKGGSSELFNSYLKLIDENVAIAVLGETLSTSQGANGARAATMVHNEVRKEKSDIDMSIVEPAMNQLIQYFAILNYGISENLTTFLFEREAELNIELVERDKKLVDTYGIDFTAEYVSKFHKIDPKYFSKKETEAKGEELFYDRKTAVKRTFKFPFLSRFSKEEKKILSDEKLISEFQEKIGRKFQTTYDSVIDEMIEKIDDIHDEKAIFQKIIEAYPELNLKEIVRIVDNIRFCAANIGSSGENVKKKVSTE